MPTSKTTIILGVDPGYAITGYGVLAVSQQAIETLTYGAITTSAKTEFPDRLASIHRELTNIIKTFKPKVLAIENLFFSNNAKTALRVGEARGVILLTAIQHHLRIHNYTPLQVKQAATGYGRAEKRQIQKMMQLILKLKKLPQPDDVADALAIAYCCAQALNHHYAKR